MYLALDNHQLSQCSVYLFHEVIYYPTTSDSHLQPNLTIAKVNPNLPFSHISCECLENTLTKRAYPLPNTTL